ncbi:MAG: VOC family protein [Oscillospiraceae bacterium]|nr:VOC family protein [Oscillospiraceae bacterium]MBQ5712037.1 VOC family protein [Oscillospiraceae bacterium]
MLGKQHHVAIICSDYAKAKAFYIDKLGFELIREVYRPEIGDYLRMLKQGDTTLELFIKPDYPERVTDPEAKGLRHLAFHVEDVDAAVAWLHARGIQTEPIREDKVNGGRFAFFKDPDGLPLEVHE